MTRTASDAKGCDDNPDLPTAAPAVFSGTLDELCARYVLQNLPKPAIVAAFHRHLVAYLREPDPLLLIRQVSGTERRNEYATTDCVRFKATDNAPAWWTHASLLQACCIASDTFDGVITKMPAHMFDVPASMKTANKSGWHIAHIFDVKDGNTAFLTWSRADAIGRFVRNVHPCNYFLIPKTDWQRWGGDRRVIAYFAELYATLYADVWAEFLGVARADISRLEPHSGPIFYSYGIEDDRPVRGKTAEPVVGGPCANCPRYESGRLLFRASVIEPLQPENAFCVVTPKGTFKMTKADFYRVFANVAHSRSYRESGYYHYPTIPQKAEPFLMPPDAAGGHTTEAS